MVKKIILILVVLAALAAAVSYTLSVREKKAPAPPGGVYDFREDQKFIQSVHTTLSIHAVMAKLASAGKDGARPEVRYGIDSMTQLGAGRVRVEYSLLYQTTSGTTKQRFTKIFRRKKDGAWYVESGD